MSAAATRRIGKFAPDERVRGASRLRKKLPATCVQLACQRLLALCDRDDLSRSLRLELLDIYRDLGVVTP